MKDNSYYRTINTAITSAGALLCIISGFLPAPDGLLTDGRISIIQALPPAQKLLLFALPAALFVAAAVLAAAGRLGSVALIAALGGACLFAVMDIGFIKDSQAFAGTLLNEAGTVLAVGGVLLHVFGTPETAAEKKSKTEKNAEAAEEKHSAHIEEAAIYGRQEGFYGGTGSSEPSGLAGRETMDLGDSLVAALRRITEEHTEGILPADAEPAAKETGAAYEKTGWTSDSELAALLRNEISKAEEPPATPETVTASEIAAAARPEDTGTEEPAAEDDSADFYAGLEDMFRI